MDVIAAYRDVGSYRGAAAICGTTHKTVKRIVEAHEMVSAGLTPPARVPRERNFDAAAGYEGSARNFRRLVAEAKTARIDGFIATR